MCHQKSPLRAVRLGRSDFLMDGDCHTVRKGSKIASFIKLPGEKCRL